MSATVRPEVLVIGSSNTDLTASSAFPDEVDSVLIVTRDGSDNLKCYIDNVDVTSGTPSNAGTWTVDILLDKDAADGWSHAIGAVCLWDGGVLTSGDRAKLQTYFETAYVL